MKIMIKKDEKKTVILIKIKDKRQMKRKEIKENCKKQKS